MALEAVLLKLHAKLAPGWALIQVNIDPIQEIVGVGTLSRDCGNCYSMTMDTIYQEHRSHWLYAASFYRGNNLIVAV